MNAALNNHSCYYRFQDKPGSREKKPAGNECRKMLWTPGIMLDLLAARYGEPRTVAEKRAAANVAAATQEGAHLADATSYEAGEAIAQKAATVAATAAAAMAPPPPPPLPLAPQSEEDRMFAAMAESMGILLPKQAPTPTPEQVLVESDDAAPEVGMDAGGTDDAEWVPDSVVGDYATALEGVHTLLHLHLELHDPWEDTLPERRKRGPAAAKVGRAWAVALRVHAGALVGHYYMHQAYAHLQETIEKHGPMQHGNDEVLERGNLTMKHFRGLTYKGGSSTTDAPVVKQTRYRLVSETGAVPEVWEGYEVLKPPQDASWVSTFKMNVAAEELQSARVYDGDTRGPSARARAASLAGRRVKLNTVKSDATEGLVAKRRAVTGKGGGVRSVWCVICLPQLNFIACFGSDTLVKVM